MSSEEDRQARLRGVRLLALDVDGTLTDGGVWYDNAGGEMKRFHIHDGLGLVLARMAGLVVVWITGRTSSLVERRAKELGVPLLMQGVNNKGVALRDAAQQFGLAPAECAFMGDDLNDLPGMDAAGVAFAPANADAAVLAHVDFVTSRKGGDGAVRDAVEIILRGRGDYEAVVSDYLASLVSPAAQNPVQ